MIEVWVLTFVLILVRVATFVAVVPIFGGQSIPKTVKIGLALALTAMWLLNMEAPPSEVIENQSHSLQWLGFILATLREFVVGLMLGMAFGVFLYPANVAGAYLAQEIGLSMASMSDPSSGANSNVLSVLFQLFATLLFFVTDMHHFVFAVLHASFAKLPVGGTLFSWNTEPLIDSFAHIDQIGLSIVAPIGICLFVTLIILLLLTKTAPSMNLFSIGLSVRIGAGLLFILIFLPNLLHAIQAYFSAGENGILKFLESM